MLPLFHVGIHHGRSPIKQLLRHPFLEEEKAEDKLDVRQTTIELERVGNEFQVMRERKRKREREMRDER